MKIKFFLLSIFVAFGVRAQVPFELLITEIMADPTPSRGLPEIEYLELYNNSAAMIQLRNYTLQYNTSEVNLPSFELASAQYVILVRRGNEANFSDIANVLALQRLSLVNAGTRLRLLHGNSVVHEVNYAATWYAQGKTEGYALEMIDMNYPCVEKENWTSSASENGGTPAIANASARTNPDSTPPQLQFFEATTPVQIVLNFDEKLDTLAAKEHQNYRFSNNATLTQINFGTDNKTISLGLSEEIPENELVDITIQNMTDCSGNVAADFMISVGNLSPADSGVVVLNEVLFNPKTGGGDYIELYNRSENSVSLKNWSFATLDADNEQLLEVISTFNLVIEPNDFLVFTENEAFLSDFFPQYQKRNVVLVDKLPALRNTDGTVLLLNNENRIYDRFDYKENLHHPIIDDPDGVALEKLSAEKPSNAVGNWQSASEESQFGTPGYENSQRIAAISENERVWVEPEIFTPDMDGLADQAELKFVLQTNGNVVTVQVMSVAGAVIKVLAQSKLLGNEGSVSWDGTDQNGNALPVGYYVFVADVFTPNGVTERFKRKVVLGRLN